MYKNYFNTVVFIYTVSKKYKGKLISNTADYVTLLFPNNEKVSINKRHIVSISNCMIEN